MRYRTSSSKSNPGGFTLVELLVALTLLALMSLLTWRGLDAVIRSRDAATTTQDRTMTIAATLGQLAVDLRNTSPQQIIVPELGSNNLIFTRLVADSAGAQREARVQWKLLNGQLIRSTQEVDGSTTVFTQPVLDQVQAMSVRMFIAGRWLNSQEIATTYSSTAPSEIQGVAIQLSLKEGDINRSFLVGGL